MSPIPMVGKAVIPVDRAAIRRKYRVVGPGMAEHEPHRRLQFLPYAAGTVRCPFRLVYKEDVVHGSPHCRNRLHGVRENI